MCTQRICYKHTYTRARAHTHTHTHRCEVKAPDVVVFSKQTKQSEINILTAPPLWFVAPCSLNSKAPPVASILRPRDVWLSQA